ncbi:MAG TPA: cytochrome c biogenesis protein CcdA [Roseiarcus sp.]|nr:cytochrome c biogenesis protein CcdA [Roseiarcus sp.]
MMSVSFAALATSFAAGVISFVSPCVLPLVPGYVSYVGGRSLDDDARARLAALPLSTLFVLGFSTVFIILGASATAIGSLFLAYRYQTNLAAGAVVIIFGLFTIGLVRSPWLLRDVRLHLDVPGARPLSAYVLGLAFAFGWTPCIGPVLGAILTTSAVSATVQQGVILLAVYSLGLGVPFLCAALLTERILRRVARLGRLGRSLQQLAGGAMVVLGLAMISGQFTAFSYWLLDTFPLLGKIG